LQPVKTKKPFRIKKEKPVNLITDMKVDMKDYMDLDKQMKKLMKGMMI